MNKLNNNEQKFLFEELAPIQFECLKDSEQKENLKFLIESHKIKNHTTFKKFLEKTNFKRKIFLKALYDTLNQFFDDTIKKEQVIKFKLFDYHKEDLIYLLNINNFVKLFI